MITTCHLAPRSGERESDKTRRCNSTLSRLIQPVWRLGRVRSHDVAEDGITHPRRALDRARRKADRIQLKEWSWILRTG